MAERRMFAKTIIDSDAFLDMPLSTQALYFHLSMRADDDGFINNPKKVQRMIGAADDDLKVLITKRFIIPFESGIVVIKHWKIHNYIQKDRYKETIYKEEKALLAEKENKAYTECIHDVYTPDTQVRLGEVKLDKDSVVDDSGEESPTTKTKRKRFTPPTVEEVQAYCRERKNNVNAQRFVDYYTANGWKAGRNPMKDWKACVRTWEQNQRPQTRPAYGNGATPMQQIRPGDYDTDELPF